MLTVNIIVEEESTFSGIITLYFNNGGVRGIEKVDNSSLKFKKADTYKPETNFISQSKST